MTQEEEAPEPKLSTYEEVKLLTVENTRNLFQLLITRPQKELGKKRNFVDRDSHLGTEGLVEYRSFKDPNYELVRATLDTGIQSSESLKTTSTQSPWCRKVNSSAQTTPATMLPEMRQSIQEQDDFLQFAHKISERVLPVLESNVSSDVFLDQLTLLTARDDSLVKSFNVSQMKEYLSLKDARYNNPVTCIDIMPNSNDTVAISFSSSSSFDHYLKRSASAPVEHIFIWNFQAILHPKYVLESPSVVNTFKFCPTRPNIIVGGCENGQVLLWDLEDENTKVFF
jgi:WD40 repeat protein